MIAAILSALLVIQLNDTMIDDKACGWNQYRKILPISIGKQVGMRYLLGIAATGILIFYAIRKIPRIPESHVFLKNAVMISIGIVLISYIVSILMWKYKK